MAGREKVLTEQSLPVSHLPEGTSPQPQALSPSLGSSAAPAHTVWSVDHLEQNDLRLFPCPLATSTTGSCPPPRWTPLLSTYLPQHLAPHWFSQPREPLPLPRIAIPACRPVVLSPVRVAQANLENRASKPLNPTDPIARRLGSLSSVSSRQRQHQGPGPAGEPPQEALGALTW